MDKISRAEAFGRVGQAKFGFDWISKLSGNEEYLLAVGPQGSGSPTAFLQVDEVLKAHRRADRMAYQRRAVEEWLQRHRLTGNQFSCAAFEKALAAEYPASVVPQATKPRGPEPGTLRRYDASDRALFPELERIMTKDKKSRSAAARALADDGKIEGAGTPDSRAKRLAALHKRERGEPAAR